MGRERRWMFAALLAVATAVAPWHVEAAGDVPDAASVLAAARAAIVTTSVSPAAPEVWSGYDAQGRRVYAAAPWVEIGYDFRADGSVAVADTRGTVRVDYPAAGGVSRHVYRTAEGVTRTVWRWHDSGGAGTRAEVVAPTLDEARAALAAAGIDEDMLRGESWDPDLLDWDWSEGSPTVHDVFGNAWMSVDSTTAADGSWITSTTSAGGTQLTVTAQAGPEGWVFSDSLGHTQTVRYYEDGTPATIVDGHGEVLKVYRDADGRVTSVLAGGRLRVDYEYAQEGRTCVAKRVTDVVTGEVLLELANERVIGGRDIAGPDTIHVPREGEGEVLLPTMGAAAGWDSGLASPAYARATVGTRPYALMLLDGSGAAYEAIWPVAGWGDDRIVFDERTVRLDLLDAMFDTQRVVGPRVFRGGEAPNRVIIRLCPNPECFCIDHGQWIEVRCPGGGTGGGGGGGGGSGGGDPCNAPGGCGGGGPGGGGGGGGGPRIAGPMDPRMRMSLRRSWHKAHDKLENNPACAALFTRPGMRFDGIFALEHSVYHDGVASGMCQPGWAAVTNVDSYQVYLCSPFLNPSYDGTNKLIHEALHTAGQHENPPSPAEIDQMVRDACGS